MVIAPPTRTFWGKSAFSIEEGGEIDRLLSGVAERHREMAETWRWNERTDGTYPAVMTNIAIENHHF